MECDAALKDLVSQHLAALEATTAPSDEGRSAAVAVAITDGGFGARLNGMPSHTEWQSQAALILTKRSSKLRNHPGQWALPGGRIDYSESAEQAAPREMHEEVGLDLDPSAVVGRLDDFITRSGFIMTPVVVWIGPQRDFIANADEVDSIHRIPIAEFMREDAPMLEDVEGGAPVLRMSVGNTWIAAHRPPRSCFNSARSVLVGVKLGSRTMNNRRSRGDKLNRGASYGDWHRRY